MALKYGKPKDEQTRKMSRDGLTEQRDLFAWNVANNPNLPYIKCYCAAFAVEDDPTWSDIGYCNVLVRDAKVQTRILEYRTAIAAKAPISTEELFSFFAEVIRNTDEKLCNRMTAAKQMSMMMGLDKVDPSVIINNENTNNAPAVIVFNDDDEDSDESKED